MVYEPAKPMLVHYVHWLLSRGVVVGSEHFTEPSCGLTEFEAFNPSWDVESVVYPVPTYFSPSSKWYLREVNCIHLPIIRAKRWLANVR